MSSGGGAACRWSIDQPKWWKGLGLRAYSVFASAVERTCREGPWWRPPARESTAVTCEGIGGGDLRGSRRRRPATAATCEGVGGGDLRRNRRRRRLRKESTAATGKGRRESAPDAAAACAPDAAATTSPGVRRQWLAPQVRRRRLRAAAACSLGGALAAGCLKSETVRWE